ncbi:hypothetical protein RHI9324_02799 [Rhizobium sp. CECT 9324]|nr:hypothetical protein RHI9324_02799 [Rhizobium sp. CECT 9324]
MTDHFVYTRLSGGLVFMSMVHCAYGPRTTA